MRDARDVRGGTRDILRQRVGDAGFVRKAVREIGEKSRVGLRASGRGEKCRERLRQQRVLRAVGNFRFGVGGKHGEQFHAFFSGQRDAACANGELLLAPGVVSADLGEKFDANDCLRRRFQITFSDRCASESRFRAAPEFRPQVGSGR